jgi:hypothetical protein
MPLFVAGAVALIATTLFCNKAPAAWVPSNQPVWINLSLISLLLLSLLNLVFYRHRHREFVGTLGIHFTWFANLTMLIASIWLLLGSIGELFDRGLTLASGSILVNPLGILMILMAIGLLTASLWNEHRRFWPISFCLITSSLSVTGVSILPWIEEWLFVSALFGAGLVTCLWGIVWLNRQRLGVGLNRLGVPSLTRLESSLQIQFPIYSLILVSVLVVLSLFGMVWIEPRLLRFLLAAVSFLLAFNLGCLSHGRRNRSLQIASLCLVTLGCLMFGWADLTPAKMFRPSLLTLLVRSLLVSAGLVFIYGGLVSRWVRAEDSWLQSLREMAVATCGIAIVFLGLVLLQEGAEFREGVGCGLSIAESVSSAVVIIGMIVGLITIAIRPQNDPFSLSIQGRQGYVYLAQLVVIGLLLHVYFTMPWLFQFGIKEYWPYIAMAICFVGVGLSRLLEKRGLDVLGQPLFTTAAILPVLTAVAIFGIDSQANGALVMLIVGLAYLMISYTNHSIWSGAASLLFGNLALWMFCGRFPNFTFLEHPQIWLIPPAISVLIAARVFRNSLTSNQLATINYVAVTVIYVSSTSEVFISGLGDKLWPPMVLAFLAVLGIMTGILMQIRSFLYLGSLFLLIAMITMVAHAHQRFDHVWPWWTFGITLGIAILVVFGLFEKRKNDLKAIAGRLKQWDG